jgi:hypothetical protein
MSSTNTPVTQADVNEWARDIGKHANNVDGTLYYYVSKAKWDQVHDMLGRLLVERVELRRNYDAVAQAVGVAYEAEGHDAVGGPVDEVVAQASRNRDDAIIADEWQQRAKKLDADVDHFHKKWKDAETRAERAEANSGVAMLRRLLFWVKNEASGVWVKAEHSHTPTSTARQMMAAEIDRMLAEAEKPAEPPAWGAEIAARAEFGDLPESSADRLGDPRAVSLNPDGLKVVSERAINPPKDREGDDVLRACREEIRRRCEDAGDKPFPPHYWFDAALDELLRRALGEEVKS